MKLMTVNIHSLVGEDFPLRAEAFFESILLELPDVIAMQEVNQTPDAPVVDSETLSRFVPCGASIPLREDNYAYWLWRKLAEEGIAYHWTWFPIKRGYGRYDEGIATFSRLPIDAVETVYLSPNRDYEDWHTRAALAILCRESREWFYNLHMSRWSRQGGFLDEWKRLKGSFSTKESLWLMGDFNNPAEVRDEGYDTVTQDGFFDSYLLAKARSGGATARRGIDGWGDGEGEDGLRIDHVWCSEHREILRYRTVFDGKDLPMISDHFGVIVEAAPKQGRGVLMREAGILLPIFSLPSRYGIGCFSKDAYRFVDFLEASGQRLWQILPMGVTGVGDSPYQSFSAFAGNPYFIDLEALCEEGLLRAEECALAALESEDGGVDYERQYLFRLPLLRLAFDRTGGSKSEEQRRFECEAAWWLTDYARFMAIKKSLGGLPVGEWREDLRRRDSETMAEVCRELRTEIEFHQFLQFHFWKQWRALKEYANAKGIRIVGDLPIYVSADSADVWVRPDLFLLDAQGTPIAVAGCPPDGFSPDGQLWGNPLYRWDTHETEGFSWWIERIRHAFSLYDVVRIDHFRGFDAYYAVPFGAKDARDGRWERGPAMALFDAVERALGKRDIIAEDLGYVTESVRCLVKDSGFAGMKILQFGWEEAEGDETTNEHLPHRYGAHCAAYTETHDNPTLTEWIAMLSPEKKKEIWRYLDAPCDSEEALRRQLLTCLFQSRAERCIVPLQDYLGVGGEGRINRPATMGSNWRWRLKGNELTETLAQRIAALTEASGR